MFDGTFAPLLYAASGQINLVSPLSLAGRATTHICVAMNNRPLKCIDMAVQPASPAIFLSGGSGDSFSYAVALNEDGTRNSAENPSQVGSVVSLFLTGLGTVTPVTPDGAVTPVPPPSLDLNWRVNVEWDTSRPSVFFDVSPRVLYIGPAPLSVEGLAQAAFVIPARPTGNTVKNPLISLFTKLPGRTQFNTPKVTIWMK